MDNNTMECDLIVSAFIMMMFRIRRRRLTGVEQRERKRVSLCEGFKLVVRIAFWSFTKEGLYALRGRCGSVDGTPDRGHLLRRV
jgi:hypothetical protein